MFKNLFKTNSSDLTSPDDRADRLIERMLKSRGGEPGPGFPSQAYWNAFWPRLRPKILSSDRAAARIFVSPLLRVRRAVPAAAGVLLLIAAAAVFLLRWPGTDEPPAAVRRARRPGETGENGYSYAIARAGGVYEPDRGQRHPRGDTVVEPDRWDESEYLIFPARADGDGGESRHVLTGAVAEAGRPSAW